MSDLKPKKPRKKAAAAAVVAALAVGAVGGRATAPGASPTQADPLGGWHYADLPLQVCTSVEGSGIGRVSVRPEIITVNGSRVTVPEYRVEGASWWACANTAEINREGVPQASDTCYRREGGDIEVTIGGRPITRLAEFPACTLDAFREVTAANPVSGGRKP